MAAFQSGDYLGAAKLSAQHSLEQAPGTSPVVGLGVVTYQGLKNDYTIVFGTPQNAFDAGRAQGASTQRQGAGAVLTLAAPGALKLGGDVGSALAANRIPFTGGLVEPVALGQGTRYALPGTVIRPTPGWIEYPEWSDGQPLGLPGRLEPLGRGSTANPAMGRWLPSNLAEQLAVDQAMQNPAAGTVAAGPMGDSRWPAAENWLKMQQTIDSGGRAGPTSVHYNYDWFRNDVDDFKIVARRPHVVPEGVSLTGQEPGK
jgi:hypothetical protein